MLCLIFASKYHLQNCTPDPISLCTLLWSFTCYFGIYAYLCTQIEIDCLWHRLFLMSKMRVLSQALKRFPNLSIRCRKFPIIFILLSSLTLAIITHTSPWDRCQSLMFQSVYFCSPPFVLITKIVSDISSYHHRGLQRYKIIVARQNVWATYFT